MKNAILVPGRPDKDQHYDPNGPSNSEDFWFSWLKRQLILKDIHTIAIEPPMPFRPRYDEWVKEFERCDINPDTLLVGHSCGGGFLVRYLSEHKDLKVGKVVLVAPWVNPENNSESDTVDFFEFEIDPDFPSRTNGVTVFFSTDDHSEVVKTVEILRRKVNGLTFKEYSDRGHFRDSPFPELLEEILA
jgi:predicted alpha/beta hydrolase family esterase